MSTYSINLGTITESDKLNDITSVLNQIPDNTSKLITPKDARDGIFTTWENIVFKQTSIIGSSVSYIGIDQKYIKSKVFFGKRQLLGGDVMNDSLLNDVNTDFYIYNNKIDTLNQNTRISLLSGTNSNIWVRGLSLSVPYIQSTYISTGIDAHLDLDIKNNSYSSVGTTQSGGNINLFSDHGYVTFNGVLFPRYIDTYGASSSEGKVLKFRSGYLKWEDVAQTNLTDLTSTGTVSLTGSPVLINGLDISFTDLTPTPSVFGGIASGSTFSSVPVTEMIRMMLYPYLYPIISLSISNNVIEITPNPDPVILNYSINKRSPTASVVYSIPNSSIAAPLTSNVSVNGNATGNNLNSTSTTPQTFIMSVSDGTSNLTTPATLYKVFPFFYGTVAATPQPNSLPSSDGVYINSILGTSTSYVQNKLTKVIELAGSKTFTLIGNNVGIYIAFPSSWGTVLSIFDQNNFDVTTSFTPYNHQLNSPETKWNSVPYTILIYNGAISNGPPQLTSIGSSPLYSAPYKINFI
jgi:hypothetical protein